MSWGRDEMKNWSLSAALSDQREIGMHTQSVETLKRCLEDGLSLEEAMRIAGMTEEGIEKRGFAQKCSSVDFSPRKIINQL